MVGIHMAMTTVAARIYTVKEINTSLNTLQNVCRSTNPHQIRRLVLRQMRNYLIQDPVHLLMALTNCQATNRITIQIHLCDRLCMLNTDILINSTLVDTKRS